LTLLGCGGGGGAPTVRTPAKPSAALLEQRAVKRTVGGWLEALVAGDNPRACAYLTPSLQRAIDRHVQLIRRERGKCPQWAARWTGGRKPPGRADAHVARVTVTGTSADATVVARPDLTSDVRLRKLRGRWLIDNY
jgi:hypothetical protein